MEENFDPVARTRANYYTPGSPVQFVCVELLKGEASGDHAVCLTFKNIARVTLTALEIHFKCKGVDGVILCEDQFEYRDIEVKPGESFGMDDAVFVTQKAITSVDVSLRNVYSGKKVVHLDAIKRVRLPAPRRLSPELQKALEARMNRQGLKYMPQVFENGWYCACGSFHPKEEDTVYCTECGCDRILLQNALNTLLQPEKKEPVPAAEPVRPVQTEPDERTRVVGAAPVPPEEPTRIVGSVPPRTEPDAEATRVMPPRTTLRPSAEAVDRPASFAPPLENAPDAESTRVLDASTRAAFPGKTSPAHADDEGDPRHPGQRAGDRSPGRAGGRRRGRADRAPRRRGRNAHSLGAAAHGHHLRRHRAVGLCVLSVHDVKNERRRPNASSVFGFLKGGYYARRNTASGI